MLVILNYFEVFIQDKGWVSLRKVVKIKGFGLSMTNTKYSECEVQWSKLCDNMDVGLIHRSSSRKKVSSI